MRSQELDLLLFFLVSGLALGVVMTAISAVSQILKGRG